MKNLFTEVFKSLGQILKTLFMQISRLIKSNKK